MNKMFAPCFFCECPAEYSGEILEVDGKFEVIEVCKYHFKGMSEASS